MDYDCFDLFDKPPICDNLKYLRELTGLSFSQLGEFLGLSAESYRSIEQGDPDKLITEEMIVKIVRFYHIDRNVLCKHKMRASRDELGKTAT